ncbi:MAG TPA: MBL fold metallo-hydrolase [Rhizomicrobium sp.]|nr:MBL fold metallo-hydrolase [Rhizomicrobium sp.]
MLRKLVTSVSFAALLAIPAAAKDGALQMVAIDVEGGGGTLFVTPEGKSLLIDTGNPEVSRATGNHPSSERIVAAASALGVKKIDYLLITHYHGDHIGGFEGLLARIPIGTVIDHGENRETTASPNPTAAPIDMKNPPPGSTAYGYQHYMQAIGNRHHIVAKPGDVFHIGSMTVTIVMADAKPLSKPLPGAGEDNPSCAGMPGMAGNGGEENARSTASVISYGKARIAAFGDLTWDREKDLFCPTDKVGKVDVYLATHHGTALSGSPAAVNALAPIVAIMGNAARKGDDPERAKTIEASPRIQGLWRLHSSTVNPQIDGDHQMIANPDADQSKDEFYNLRLRIQKSGEITVINERNGFNKTYQVK